MNLYKLTPKQCDEINAFNETQTNTLLIVCDYGGGRMGVDADALQHSKFAHYLPELDHVFDAGNIEVVDVQKEEDDIIAAELAAKEAK
jgi:hypothetical protein